MEERVFVCAPKRGGNDTQYDGMTLNGGASAIASVLDRHGYAVDIDTSASVGDLPMKDIESGRYLAVGISAMTCQYPAAVELCRAIKMWSPETLVVIGGVHVSALEPDGCNDLVRVPYGNRPENAFLIKDDRKVNGEPLYDGFDVGVIKLGGNALVEVLQIFKSGNRDFSEVRGIVFRDGDEIVRTPDRSYPYVFPDDYTISHNFTSKGLRPICSSTSCQGKCSYCYAKKAHPRILLRSNASFMEEWRRIPTKDSPVVFIVDDSYVINKKERLAQLAEMAKNPRWFAIQARTEDFFVRKLLVTAKAMKKGPLTRTELLACLDRKFLRALADAGCYMVCLGVESPDADNLQNVGKNQEIEMVRLVCDALRKELGILVMYMTMIFPTDTRATHEAILREAKRSADALQVHNLTPILGTPYLEEIRDYLIKTDYGLMDGMHAVTEMPGGASAYEQQMALISISDRFYSDIPRAIWHAIRYRRLRPADKKWLANFRGWAKVKYYLAFKLINLIYCYRQPQIMGRWKKANADFLEDLRQNHSVPPELREH